MVARDWEGCENKKCLLNGYALHWRDDNVVELNGGGGCITL